MKNSTRKHLMLTLFLTGVLALSAAEAVDPNTRTSWPSPYPLGELLLKETFQDWPNTRTYSLSPLDCNANNRTSNFNWNNYRVHRPSGESGAQINMYLISCEIQPFCDTQSGTYYLIDSTLTGTDKLGQSNPLVTLGNITMLDSANTFVTDSANNRLRRGAVIVGQLPSISLIQYTMSSYGNKRGFTLEYSTDHGATWTVIRREHGKTIDSTMTTSGYQLVNSPKGIVWEDEVNLSDAMLRWTINNNQPQLVRIHDIRIYGMSPLREDPDDSAYEALSAISWGAWLGVSRTSAEPSDMSFANGTLQISGQPLWTKVFGMTGQCLRSFGSEQIIDLSALPKGIYLVQTKNDNGRIGRLKVAL